MKIWKISEKTHSLLANTIDTYNCRPNLPLKISFSFIICFLFVQPFLQKDVWFCAISAFITFLHGTTGRARGCENPLGAFFSRNLRFMYQCISVRCVSSDCLVFGILQPCRLITDIRTRHLSWKHNTITFASFESGGYIRLGIWYRTLL